MTVIPDPLSTARGPTVATINLSKTTQQYGFHRRGYQEPRPGANTGTWVGLCIGILILILILGLAAWGWRRSNKEAGKIEDTEAVEVNVEDKPGSWIPGARLSIFQKNRSQSSSLGP